MHIDRYMVVMCTLVFLPANGKSAVVVSIMSVGLAHYGGIKAVRFSGRMPDQELAVCEATNRTSRHRYSNDTKVARNYYGNDCTECYEL